MEWRATELSQRVKIRDDDNFEPISIVDFFKHTVNEFPDNYALASRDEKLGGWRKCTFREYHAQVEKMAKVFIKLGLEQRGVVAILSWNRPEWVIAALGAIHSGGVVTGIYTTNSSAACEFILVSSKAQILIVEDAEQLQKINEIEKELPDLKHIIKLSNFDVIHLESVLNWNELMQIDTSDIEGEYERRLAEIVPNECCALIFTSGTSGFPKAAMMSHDNLIWNARMSERVTSATTRGEERVVSYLPLSHAAAFMSDIFHAIHGAGVVYFVDFATLKSTLLQALQEIQPTVFISVPRVFEKIEEKLSERVAEASFAKRKLFEWAQAWTLHSHFHQPTTLFASLKCNFATRLVTARVRGALGFQHCKLFITGSAPLREATKKFFISLGMPTYEAYGMTESSTVHTLTSHAIQLLSLETVGVAMPGAETKIVSDKEDSEGEICIRGRHVFMGYLRDPEKTRATIDDEGWLHTGDAGRLDERGLLFVTGRLKEILITSGGENIPAVRIENLVKGECGAISNAVLIGDSRKFLSVLLTLKTDPDGDGMPTDVLSVETCKWLKSFDLNYTKLSELLASRDERLSTALQSVIDCVNAKAIANPQKIQKFALLPRDFSIATEELTPTLKVKRFFVVKKYKDLIEQFYK